MVILLLALLIIVGDWTLAKPSTAQDSHYWTMQYGPRSTLLGGAVVGSLMDVSSTYYNPGALGLIEDPSVVLSAYGEVEQRIRSFEQVEDADDEPSKSLGLDALHCPIASETTNNSPPTLTIPIKSSE